MNGKTNLHGDFAIVKLGSTTDFIGDVHGHADKLEELLTELGYKYYTALPITKQFQNRQDNMNSGEIILQRHIMTYLPIVLF